MCHCLSYRGSRPDVGIVTKGVLQSGAGSVSAQTRSSPRETNGSSPREMDEKEDGEVNQGSCGDPRLMSSRVPRASSTTSVMTSQWAVLRAPVVRWVEPLAIDLLSPPPLLRGL